MSKKTNTAKLFKDMPTAAELGDEVKKDVELIHSYANGLNLVPRKLMDALLLNARSQAGPEFYAAVPTLLEQIGYTSRDMKCFVDALDCLLDTKIEWGYLSSVDGVMSEERLGATTFIAGYEITNRKVLEFSFSPQLMRRIHSPTVYECLDMAVNRRFTRVGAYALYQNCKRFAKIGKTPWTSLQTWRGLLDATSPIYDTTFRFMEKVFKPAVDEVNSVSGMSLDMEVIREARKITQIRFAISMAQQQPLELPVEAPGIDAICSSEIYKILINDFGISGDVASRWVLQYPEEYIRGNIQVTMDSVESGVIKKNVSGFLVRAIEKDYRKKETILDRRQRDAQNLATSKREEIAADNEQRRKEREVVQGSVWSAVSKMPEDERRRIYTQFVAKYPYLFKFSKKHEDDFVTRGCVVDSPMVSNLLVDYLAGAMSV